MNKSFEKGLKAHKIFRKWKAYHMKNASFRNPILTPALRTVLECNMSIIMYPEYIILNINLK